MHKSPDYVSELLGIQSSRLFVKNATDRLEFPAHIRSKCMEILSLSQKVAQVTSSAEHDERSSPKLQQAKESFSAITVELNNWKDNIHDPLDLYQLLVKSHAELEGIRDDLMLDANLSMRAALSKAESTTQEEVYQRASQRTEAQSAGYDLYDFLWLRTVCRTLVDLLFSPLSGSYDQTRSLSHHHTEQDLLDQDETLNNMVWNIIRSIYQRSDISKYTTFFGTIGTAKSIVTSLPVSRAQITRLLARSPPWIHLQSAPRVEALLSALAACLPAGATPNPSTKDIIPYLQANPLSLLIAFDDSEMPESPTDVEALMDVLDKLCRSTDLCIVLTTGNVQLPDGVGWLRFVCRPLPTRIAAATFKAIGGYSDDVDDEEIKNLVLALGCVPFSVSIAGRLRSKPADLLKQLKTSNNSEVGRFDDIIQISLTSQPFASSPDIITLLSILSWLPQGAPYDHLTEIAPLIKDPAKKLKTLLKSGHIGWDLDGFIVVYAQTRSYLSRYHALDPSHINALKDYYFSLCEDGICELGTEKFASTSKALALEGENARTVLLYALQNDPTTAVLRAVAGYANFLYHHIPHIDVTAKALDVIEKHPSLDVEGNLLPLCLLNHAKLLLRIDKYLEAEAVLQKAEMTWKESGNWSKLGRVCVLYGQINRLLGRQALAVESCTKAREYFERVDDRIGVAESLQGLATISFRFGDISEAKRLLNDAKQHCGEHGPSSTSISYYMAWVSRHDQPAYSASLLLAARESYVKYGARVWAALCMYQLGIAQYSSGSHNEAQKCLLLAYQEFNELDNYGQMGYTLDHLVELEVQKGNMRQALEYNKEARAIFEQIGNHAEIVDCYVSQGRVLAQMGRADDAREAYDKARAIAVEECSDTKLLQVVEKELQSLDSNSLSGWQRLFSWWSPRTTTP
ncbi:hypothetical protein APHAL10511_005338 [Amanita phalloides]|nr:hypothetical protein APHAL10511_005338 [Amanita phalloides]